MNSKRFRSGVIYLLLVIALGAFLYTSLARRPTPAAANVAIGDVGALVREGNVRTIEVDGDKLIISKVSGELLQSRLESGESVVNTLRDLGVTSEQIAVVDIAVAAPQFWDTWSNLLIAVVQCATSSNASTRKAVRRPCSTTSASLASVHSCLLYTSPSPRDRTRSRMPSSA